MTFSRILLLGKDGQVGTALQPRLARLGEIFTHGRETCDLANPDQLRGVIRDVKPDLIVNAAAYTAVDRAESESGVCRSVNAIGPGLVAEEARAIGAWLIHYSSDYVFDGLKKVAYVEDDTPSPLSVYGRSKLEGDRAIAAATQNYIIFRVSWVYGPAGRNFAQTILKLAAERDELRIVADQFGAPTSADFIADVTAEVAGRHIANVTDENAQKLQGIFNLAPSGRVSWHEYAIELVREAKRQGRTLRLSEDKIYPISSNEYPTTAARPKNSLLDTRKIRQVLGLNLPDWRAPLKQFIAQLGN